MTELAATRGPLLSMSDRLNLIDACYSEVVNQWADEYEPRAAWEKQVSKALKELGEAIDAARTMDGRGK